MNNQEAKLILQAYRAGGQDANDPMFAEALEQTRRDPELQHWFAAEQALDARAQARVRQAIVIPGDLKARLLAQRSMVRPPVGWRPPAWLAAAAALAVLAGLAFFWWTLPNAPQFAALRDVMVEQALAKAGHVGFESENQAQVRGWLAAQHGTVDFELPASLRDAQIHGCKVIEWRGRHVTMLCLAAGGRHVDVFVMVGTRFSDFTPTSTAQFGSVDGLTTAVWSSGGETYLLAGNVTEQQIKSLL